MPPARKHARLDAMEKVFVEFGIHLLEKFPDGQTRWGNQAMSKPYKGLSCMAQRSIDFSNEKHDFYDLGTVGAIIYRLEKQEHADKIFAELDKHILDE